MRNETYIGTIRVEGSKRARAKWIEKKEKIVKCF